MCGGFGNRVLKPVSFGEFQRCEGYPPPSLPLGKLAWRGFCKMNLQNLEGVRIKSQILDNKKLCGNSLARCAYCLRLDHNLLIARSGQGQMSHGQLWITPISAGDLAFGRKNPEPQSALRSLAEVAEKTWATAKEEASLYGLAPYLHLRHQSYWVTAAVSAVIAPLAGTLRTSRGACELVRCGSPVAPVDPRTLMVVCIISVAALARLQE